MERSKQLKINQYEYTQILNYLKNKTTPDISNNLFKKMSHFRRIDNTLTFDNKVVIPRERITDHLNKAYGNNLFGREKLFGTVQDRVVGVTNNDVSNFLKNNETHQLHTVAPLEKVHRPIISSHALERVEADLIDLDGIKNYNKNYRYVLTIIDHFSKFAWAYPLTQKTDDKVLEKIKIFVENQRPRKIKLLQSDNGAEFINHKLKEYLAQQNIQHITSSPYHARSNGVIERFNRTIKQMLYKTITETNSNEYLSILDKLMTSYNSSYHTTIKNIPYKIFSTESPEKLKEVKHNIEEFADKLVKPDEKKYKRGDYVRISLQTLPEIRKDTFDKKYTQNYSTEIYKIKSVSRAKIHEYGLLDKDNVLVNKKYYYDQLLLVPNPETMYKAKPIEKQKIQYEPAQPKQPIQSDYSLRKRTTKRLTQK